MRRGRVGEAVRRDDARPKVTGEFAYSSDLHVAGMLWGRTVRSPHAHARIVSVDTQEALYAGYLAAWKMRVEQLGTLNFPDAARRAGLAGNPVLEVAIGSDGALREIIVVRSSQQKLLDQAALRILRLAAPFEPFPEELKREYDVLRFVYEWRFIGQQYDDDRNQFSLDECNIVNARIGWRPRSTIEIYAGLENVFDAEQDVGRTPIRTIGLPRTARVGMRWSTR